MTPHRPESASTEFPSDLEIVLTREFAAPIQLVFDVMTQEEHVRRTYLEVEPPTRTVQTWHFDGWPDTWAVESMDLSEAHGVTTMRYSLAFRDQAGRDHMSRYDGLESKLDNVVGYVHSLVDSPTGSQPRLTCDHAFVPLSELT